MSEEKKVYTNSSLSLISNMVEYIYIYIYIYKTSFTYDVHWRVN
jgi:hypothetical protein